MAKSEPIMEYLKIILGNEVSNDIVSYIKSFKQEEDYEEFMENIVDKNNNAHVRSYEGIKNIVLGSSKNKSNNTKNTYSQKSDNQTNQNRPGQHKKGKTKFRDINTYQTKKKEKDGRTACDCLGQEHEFMNNCLVCGRIHCMEEGPGPCLFCGNSVTVRGDESFNMNGAKAKSIMKPKENKVFDDDNDYFKVNSKKKRDKESKQKMIIALDFATRRVIESTREDAKIREKLLEESVEHLKKVEKVYKNIQKRSEKVQKERTQVNDDLVNLLIQMRHKKPVGIEDLGQEDGVMPIIDYGTRVFDEDLMATVDHGLCLSMHQPYASLLVAGVKKHEGRTWPTTHRGRLWIAAAAKVPDEDEIDALESFYREYYQDKWHRSFGRVGMHSVIALQSAHFTVVFHRKDRDVELQIPPQDVDSVYILSIQGLFVFNCHQGQRDKTRDKKDPTLSFPKEYPTSCLLGCIFVDDCLEQEVYRKKFPNGESNSPFVLICSNPIILPIFYPIIGKHKIYPLDKELHKCAKMALQHAKYIS